MTDPRPAAEPSDAALLRAARRDPDAFFVVYERHFEALRRWLRSRTTSEQTAFDLAAETFAQALRGLDRFRDEAGGSARPWLLGIARNLLVDSQRRERVETSARARLGIPLDGYGVADFDAADERSDAERLAPRLSAAVAALPAEQRAALELRVVDELPYGDVARQLGCSEVAARQRVLRALRSLRAGVGRR